MRSKSVKLFMAILALGVFCFTVAACSKSKNADAKKAAAAPPPPKLASTYLKLEKIQFTPDDILTVVYTAPATFDKSAWFGVIPSATPHGVEAVNDEADIAFHLLNGETSGTHHFPVPQTPGNYDIRLFDTDHEGKEVDSISFTVVAKPKQP